VGDHHASAEVSAMRWELCCIVSQFRNQDRVIQFSSHFPIVSIPDQMQLRGSRRFLVTFVFLLTISIILYYTTAQVYPALSANPRMAQDYVWVSFSFFVLFITMSTIYLTNA
jgi:hypothetical protein